MKSNQTTVKLLVFSETEMSMQSNFKDLTVREGKTAKRPNASNYDLSPSFKPGEVFNPISIGAQKREIGINNNLLNDSNFARFWSQRGIPEKDIAKYKDVDGDGVEDLVAYQNGNVVGFNQYYVTEPNTSQQAYRKQYYSQDKAARKAQSYTRYRNTLEDVDGFMSLVELKKRKQESDIAKILDAFKVELAEFETVNEREMLAQTFAKMVKLSIFEDGIPIEDIKVIQSASKFKKLYKAALEKLLDNITLKTRNTSDIIDLLVGVIRKDTKSLDQLRDLLHGYLAKNNDIIPIDLAKTLVVTIQKTKFLNKNKKAELIADDDEDYKQYLETQKRQRFNKVKKVPMDEGLNLE